jgi:hypothetical protein
MGETGRLSAHARGMVAERVRPGTSGSICKISCNRTTGQPFKTIDAMLRELFGLRRRKTRSQYSLET